MKGEGLLQVLEPRVAD